MAECEVNGLVALLWTKNAQAACAAFRTLQDMSGASSCVYPYLDEFFELRQLLNHLTDEKPITARQCVQAMPEIARACPALSGAILTALESADFSSYRDSMRPLLQKDAVQAVSEIRAMG